MKRHRHLVANRTVWSNLIVVNTPSLAFTLSLVETEEPVRVQTLAAELAVEAFADGILPGLAGIDQRGLDLVIGHPLQQRPRDELRLVVGAQIRRRTAFADQP